MTKLLIVGLPFFPHKYHYVLDCYKRLNVDVRVLLNSDKGAITIEEPILSNDIFFYAGVNKLGRLFRYLQVLYCFKPKNIDCYDYSILSLFYVIVARILGINVRFWLIGGELVGDKQDANNTSFLLYFFVNVKKYLSRACLFFANVIYAKELHHIRTIESISSRLVNKIESIYNCVPVSDFRADLKEIQRKDFLYANAVIESRNVDALINSFNDLTKKNISYSAAVYGFSSISNDVYSPRGVMYSKEVLKLYYHFNLGNSVEVYGFVKNIKDIMPKYKFFILPAHRILANYALLEAMSFGVVPIIYPGDGYEMIVKNGENGIVAEDFNLTKALELALSLSDDEYEKMSLAAHKTIKENFSLNLWQNKLGKHLF